MINCEQSENTKGKLYRLKREIPQKSTADHETKNKSYGRLDLAESLPIKSSGLNSKDPA